MMTQVATDLVAAVLATFIPLYAGAFTPRILNLRRKSASKTLILLSAVSAGIMFWFFLDIMGEAALLDVNQGLNAPTGTALVIHVVLPVLFAASVVSLLGLELYSKRKTSISEKTSTAPSEIFAGVTSSVAALAALGIGFHALGEGVTIGASISNSSSLIEAIGGVSPGIAYVLHKVLEGLVVGAFSLLAGLRSVRRIGLLGFLSGFPTVLGLLVGLPSLVQASYFFALGGGAAMYIEIKLIPVFAGARFDSVSIAFMLLGFYSMYVAGLFHS